MDFEQVRAIADELNLRTPKKWREYLRLEHRVPVFTGWKTDAISAYRSADAMVEELESIKSPSQVTFVGQWLWYDEDGKKNYYVNLPGMQGGTYVKGEEFYIGDERVYSNTPPEEIERLLKLGLKKLLLLVKVHG